MLRWRTVTALILAPLVLGGILLGKWTVLLLVLLVVARAAQELARALKPLPFPAALGAGILPVLLAVPYGASGVLAGVFLSLPWTLFWLAGRPEARTLRAILALLLMSVWVGASMAHLSLIERLPDGKILILIAVVGPWISDSGAYFSGLLFGKHYIFPQLSPRKTIEGSIGGLVTTAIVVGFAAHYFLDFPPLWAALSGAMISVLSQAGDLFESILKRILDLKELGRALPGHGGILDRIDSLLFTAPATYYLLLLVSPMMN